MGLSESLKWLKYQFISKDFQKVEKNLSSFLLWIKISGWHRKLANNHELPVLGGEIIIKSGRYSSKLKSSFPRCLRYVSHHFFVKESFCFCIRSNYNPFIVMQSRFFIWTHSSPNFDNRHLKATYCSFTHKDAFLSHRDRATYTLLSENVVFYIGDIHAP